MVAKFSKQILLATPAGSRSMPCAQRKRLKVTARYYNFCFTVLVCLFLGALQQAAVHADALHTVTHVVDGDTIVLENGEVVRLLGIDAPEIKHTTKAGVEMGKEAAAFTRKLVEGKKVRLEFDLSNSTTNHKDSWKRTLAYVFLSDGTFVNAELVKQGYAFIIPGFVHKYQKEFERLEREARENKRGLWKNAF